MDCEMVPLELRYRSIALVNKHWTAEADGCEDYARHYPIVVVDKAPRAS